MTNVALRRWSFLAGLVIALLVCASVVSIRGTWRLDQDAAWVNHTREVIDHLRVVEARLRDAELAARNALLIGGDELPKAVRISTDQARQGLEGLRRLTRDNPEQQARIPGALARTEELAVHWQRVMALGRDEGLEAARAAVASGARSGSMADVAALLHEMEADELSLLAQRTAHTRRSFHVAVATEVFTALVSILGVIAALTLLRRYVRTRDAAAARIAEQAERLRTTLTSIGDAVVTTDAQGRVTSLNPVAEHLTGFTERDALGRPLESIFRIVNEQTREPTPNPTTRVLAEGVVVGLANHTVLIARDGTERPIDDSAAPIRAPGQPITGCVLVFRDVTERRHAEQSNATQLLAAQSFAALVEGSSDAIIRKSLDGTIEMWNPGAEKLFGYGATEILGQPITLIVPADRIDEERELIASVRRGQPVRPFESVRVHRDGRRIAVALSLSPIRDEHGAVIAVSTIARDITAEREAEQHARRLLEEAATANAKFHAFFDQGPLFAGIMDLDGRLLEANRLSLEACGFSVTDVLGKPFWETPWWSPSPALAARIRAASALAAAGDVFRAELPYYVADGSERRVDFAILPIRDGAGRVVCLAPTGTDITDRTRAEEDRQKFVTLVDSSTDFIAMCDLDGVPFYVNPAGLERVGLASLDEARALHVGDFFYPEDRARVLEEFLPAVRERGHGAIEIRFRHFRGGEPRWMVYKVLKLADATGQAIGFATVSQDVTERRRLEEDSRRLAAELSDADRRKDEFLAILAHELRNPLAPMRNSLKVIRRSPERAVREQALATIERQLEQMVRLVDDLLDVSRITTGKLELRRDRVPIAAVVSSAVETSRPAFERAGQELVVTMPPTDIAVDGDPLRLAQVFSNLLNNGAKYGHRGGRVWVTVTQQDGEVAVSVRDTGIGIAAIELPRIFDLFSQVDSALDRAQGGLGIGLTLAKRLIEMHGGTIEARSAGVGCGSEFIVRLPVVAAAAQPAHAPAASDKSQGGPARRVLVVDDNQDGADSIAMLLRLMGHESHTAYDGQQGIDLARELEPHVVLLDIGLPVVDGYEACRRMRREPWSKDAVFVAVTGWGQENDRRKSRAAGFDHHLVKPVDPDHLLRLMSQLDRAEPASG